jgi:hypothetical protein
VSNGVRGWENATAGANIGKVRNGRDGQGRRGIFEQKILRRLAAVSGILIGTSDGRPAEICPEETCKGLQWQVLLATRGWVGAINNPLREAPSLFFSATAIAKEDRDASQSLDHDGSPDTGNLSKLETGEYDEILLASDLMITDNRISSSLGKAVCGLIPSLAIRNSYRFSEIMERTDRDAPNVALEMESDCMGSVFPFEVFPIWTVEDVNVLGLFSENPIEKCICTVEMFGDTRTQDSFRQLLTNATYFDNLRARQHDYISVIQRLRTGEETLLSTKQ